MTIPRTSRSVQAIAAAVLAVALLAVLAADATRAAAAKDPKAARALTVLRPMLFVGNNWEGTADVFDPETFDHVARLNIAPDFQQVTSQMTPDEQQARQLNNEFAAEGNDQLVDDLWASPDGETLYVSRPSLLDAVAIDLETGTIKWRAKVPGYRPDHMALSPDGRELLVSATIDGTVQVLDTANGAVIDTIPAGDFPHENNYSADGSLIFNGSIGRVITPDFQLLDPAKGRRWLTIADATTHNVINVIEFEAGVRPYVVLPDNRTMYVQLSFFNGLHEVDLATGQITRTLNLPLSEEAAQMEHSDYPLDSAHHGLALNDDGSKLCAAATISDYVAIIDRETLDVDGIVNGGDMPYWATASADGEYCFVANSKSDDVTVVSFDNAELVATLPVGDHPQRMRMLNIPVPKLFLDPNRNRVKRGKRTRVTFTVRAATGAGPLAAGGGSGLNPVPGATVKIGKRTEVTGHNGTVTIRKRFRRPGRIEATVTASGMASGKTTIKVRKAKSK